MKLEIDIPYTGVVMQDIHAQQLLSLVLEAHTVSAANQNNASSVYFVNTLAITDNMASAIASAVLTLGKTHAPITQARSVFAEWTQRDIIETIEQGAKVPGFGNSFYKDDIDPAWFKVREYIKTFMPDIHLRLESLTTMVNAARQRRSVEDEVKPIFPNPAMYSAVVTELFGWATGSELSLFILARLPTWVSLVCKAETKGSTSDI